jgi:hypothetical protein
LQARAAISVGHRTGRCILRFSGEIPGEVIAPAIINRLTILRNEPMMVWGREKAQKVLR